MFVTKKLFLYIFKSTLNSVFTGKIYLQILKCCNLLSFTNILNLCLFFLSEIYILIILFSAILIK